MNRLLQGLCACMYVSVTREFTCSGRGRLSFRTIQCCGNEQMNRYDAFKAREGWGYYWSGCTFVTMGAHSKGRQRDAEPRLETHNAAPLLAGCQKGRRDDAPSVDYVLGAARWRP